MRVNFRAAQERLSATLYRRGIKSCSHPSPSAWSRRSSGSDLGASTFAESDRSPLAFNAGAHQTLRRLDGREPAVHGQHQARSRNAPAHPNSRQAGPRSGRSGVQVRNATLWRTTRRALPNGTPLNIASFLKSPRIGQANHSTATRRSSTSLRSTRTDTGLSVTAQLDCRNYPTGIEPTFEQLQSLRLEPHEILPKWNYTISSNL